MPQGTKKKITKIVDGQEIEEWVEVDENAEDVRELAWPARSEMRLLNHPIKRIDGPLKITGAARYSHDVRLPGMLWGKLLCCPVPRARVKIDIEKASAVPGVAKVLVLEEKEANYLGQPLVAICAETPEQAEDGLRAVEIEIIERRWAVDREQALAEDAVEVTRRGNLRNLAEVGDQAETEAALEACEVTVTGTYTCPVQHHVCLETHGIVVDYRGGDEATVYASTQHTQSIAGEAATHLKLEESQVRVFAQHMGGGFGSKFGIGLEGQVACRLARELKRPVHMMLGRREEFLMAGNRSASYQRLRAGVNFQGELTVLASEVERYGGLGRGSHPGQPYIYKVGKSWTKMDSVFTHTNTSRAFRAPGHPQASFAIESVVDELAFKLGMDPIEFRKRNLHSEVYERQLDLCAERIGWNDHPGREEPGVAKSELAIGIGFAVSTWGGGGQAVCEVDVVIRPDGSVSAEVGSQDLGTGTRTYLAAIVAETLGLPLEAVRARLGDNQMGNANPSGGSTTTASLAPAIYDAATQARDAFCGRVAETLGIPPARVRLAEGRVFDAENPEQGLDWRAACASLGRENVTARGIFQQSLAGNGVHGAQAAKVEVDTLTGAVRVLKMVCVQDCGLPLNRMAIKSQLQGGMVQSLSYALLEERVLDADLGVALNANLEDYKIVGTLEIPEMEAIIDEGDTRNVVIGIGEPPIIPGQSAIANAVFNACGVRIRHLPLTPDKILSALNAS